jgi:hypothetical protein
MGTQFIELAIHVLRRAERRTFENHVLEKMAYPSYFIGFVAGPRTNEKTDSY